MSEVSQGARPKGFSNKIHISMKNGKEFNTVAQDLELSQIMTMVTNAKDKDFVVLNDSINGPLEIAVRAIEISSIKCQYTHNLEILNGLGTEEIK